MRNLVKKISAVVTLVAMIATLGMTALATDATGAAVTITGYEWSEISNGVATVTVTYTVTDDSVGALGATMLTYASGAYDGPFEGDDDGIYNDETPYEDTMQIVGIDQGAPKTLVEGVLTPVEAVEGVYPAGTYVVQFPVAVSATATSADGVQLGSGEEAVILIGGDNVTTPAALLLTAPYIAWEVDSISALALGTVALGSVTVYSETEEAWLEAVAEAAVAKLTAQDAGYAVVARDGDEAEDYITLEGLDLTATAVVNDANYDVTVTVPANTPTDAYKAAVDAEEAPTAGGKVPAGGKTFVVTVSATKDLQMPKWEVKGDAVLEDGTTINVEVEDIESGTLAADVKAALVEALTGKKVTLNVEKEGEEDSTVVIDVTADMISVTEVVTDGDAKTYIGKVTVAAADGPYTVVGDDDTLTLEEDIVIAISGTVAAAPSFIYGDADGDGFVTGLDATVVLRHVAGYSETINLAAADVDSDGFVTGLDATIILRTVAGFYQESDLPLAQ